MKEPMVTLTESAILHIKKIVEKENGIGFRIGVKETKCLGSSYDMQVVKDKNPADHEYEQNGLRIFIDTSPESLKALKNGVILDLVTKGLGQKQLDFINPNVKAKCGCGDSFSIKDPEESE